MQRNPFIPYIIISAKLFKLEQELFQTKTSFFKKFLLTTGLLNINIPEFAEKIEALHGKYKEILNKTNKEDIKEVNNYATKLEECIIAFEKIIYALLKKLVNNNSLNLENYQNLIDDYKKRKSEFLEISEKIVTTTKEQEEKAWQNLENSLQNWERKSKETRNMKDKDKDLPQDFEKDIQDITENPLHSTLVHKTLRNFALYKTMAFIKTCGLIATGELENVFLNTWIEKGGDKKLLQKETFKPILMNKGENLKIFAVKMPKTQRVTEASWIALKPGLYKMFYTLEQTKDNDYALCGWALGEDEQPIHYYFKDGIKDNLEDFIKAILENSK
jgi:hypothetical protein